MAEGKKSIVVYADWINKFDKLTDEEAGRLIKHFFYYVNDLNPKPVDRLTELMFVDIEQQLKRDLKKWEERAERSRENGLKGGRPTKNKDEPKETQQVISEPRKPDTVNVDVTVNVDDNVNVNVKENNKSNPPAKSPVHKECKEFFLNFYEEKKGTGYYFQAIDGKKLNSIIKKIDFKIKEKGCAEKEKDLEVIRGFKIFIEYAYKDTDNWTRDNFSLSVIDSKFNDIFSKIKNGQSTSDNKSADRHALAEQLRAMRKRGASSFG